MTGNPTNAMICDTRYLQNEFSDPDFFYVFNLVLSFSTYSQSFNKICLWEVLGANVLKLCPILTARQCLLLTEASTSGSCLLLARQASEVSWEYFLGNLNYRNAIRKQLGVYLIRMPLN